MKRIFYFIFIFLFFHCKQNPKIISKKGDFTKNSTQNSDSLKIKFNVFFTKFTNDSVFQKERLKNIINMYSYNDYDKMEVSQYSKKEFSFMDFTKDTLAYKKKFNKYKVEMKIEKDSTIYYMYGIDNGIHEFYVFKRNNLNKWYLVTIHDYSH